MHIPPDWGIFFTLIVSFLVFWFIFDRLFFGPFLKLLGDRENKLKDLSARFEIFIATQAMTVPNSLGPKYRVIGELFYLPAFIGWMWGLGSAAMAIHAGKPW